MNIKQSVEASNVINDPKCNKGPKCNNVLALNVIKGLIIYVIGFSLKYNGSLNSIHVCSITAPSLIKSLTETCDDINVIASWRFTFFALL